ncbi:MAG: hypothetical protein OXC79_00205 [Candidatus Poribacteria bacterium]|nr:hypothetical protein [Candidatus Poribacteria bacterium]
MNAVMGILRSTKQKKIAWVEKQLPIILIILLVTADNMVTHSISGHWVPILGFVLGAGLMCFGFFQVFPLFSEIRIKEVVGREKIAWISGILLLIAGGVVVTLNNSIALIFKVQWLYASWGSIVLGSGLICLGYWTLTLFSELFKGNHKWKFIGIFFHSLLLVELLFKFGLGW